MSSKELPPTIEGTRIGRMARFCYERRRLVLISWIVGFHRGYRYLGSRQGKVRGQVQRRQFAVAAGPEPADQEVPGPGRRHRQRRVPHHGPRHVAWRDGRHQRRRPAAGHLPPRPQHPGTVRPGGPEPDLQTDPHIAYSVIQFDKTTQDLPKADMVTFLARAKALNTSSLEVELGGQPIAKGQAFSFGISEFVGIIAAIVILLIAFGSLVAMGLPLLTAVLGLVIGIGLVDLVSHVVTVPTFATQLAVMIGLGVGIDYALFIVTRYRQGLHEGVDPEDAVIIALATAGRAVLFAGTTVIISLFGMMLMGLSFVYGLAFAAILAVIMVMAASLTLLPAMLGFTGRAIDKVAIPHLRHRGDARQTAAWRWSRVIQRHPWAGGHLRAAGAAPLLDPVVLHAAGLQRLGQRPDQLHHPQGLRPAGRRLRAGHQRPAGHCRHPPPRRGRSGRPHQGGGHRSRPIADAAFVSPPSLNPAGDTAVIVVLPKTAPQDAATQSFVHRVRQEVPQALGRYRHHRLHRWPHGGRRRRLQPAVAPAAPGHRRAL